jgi:HEPN domain-containing protein
MIGINLGQDYFLRAKVRRKAVQVLKDESAHADVVRECQEIVELLLKGALRVIGIDPPKWHDVGQIIIQHSHSFPAEIATNVARIAKISSDLRKNREMSFYGDDDFLPTQGYDIDDSTKVMIETDWLLDLFKPLFDKAVS